MPLYTWGANPLGQLGDGTTVSKSTPTQISLFDTINDSWSVISTGNTHTLAIRGSDLSLWASGTNSFGELGDGTTINKSTLVKIGSSSWTSVSAGNSQSFGITTNGTLFTWGFANASFPLGDGGTISRSSPVTVQVAAFPYSFYKSAIRGQWIPSAGATYGINATIRKSDGALFTWGNNIGGGLGDGTTVDRNSPVQIGTSSWTIVSTNGRGTAAIDIAGRLFIWGDRSTTTGTTGSSPVQVGNSSWSFVKMGFQQGAAIDINGRLFTWGANSDGELGDNTTVGKNSPVQVGNSSWVAVDIGGEDDTIGSFMAGITYDGRLFTWGTGIWGNLGNLASDNKSSPVQVGTSMSWTRVACRSGGGVAINTQGLMWAWGRNTNGEIGNGTVVATNSPVQIGSSSWAFVSAATNNVAGITYDGRLFTWGNNTNSFDLGQGNGAGRKSSPVQIAAGTSFKTISQGERGGIAVDTTDNIWVYGDHGTTLNYGLYTPINNKIIINENPSFLSNTLFTKVSAGNRFAAAIEQITNRLFVWGSNSHGQLGDGTTITKSSPVQVLARTTDQYTIPWSNTISMGGLYGWALSANGSLYFTGLNSGVAGQTATLPVNQYARSFIPLGTVAGVTSWVDVSSGPLHTIARDSTGKLWAWGDNSSGQLGDGTIVSKSSPVQIGSDSWTVIATNILAGDLNNSFAVRNSNLYTWGQNVILFGDYRATTGIGFSSPVLLTGAVSNSDSWKVLSAGQAGTGYVLGIRNEDSSLWAWGGNSDGSLGDNTIISKSSPVKIGTSSWLAVSAGSSHALGVDITGRLYAWGNNSGGQLGDGTTINRSSPVQIGSLTTWTDKIASNFFTSYAIDNSGKLFGWGINSGGQQADYTATENRSSPVQIPSTYTFSNSWKAVSSGATHSLGIRASDSSLWAWGDNSLGNLGDGTTVNKSIPIKIGTSSWSKVTAGIGLQSAAIDINGRLFCWGSNATGTTGDGTTIRKSSPVLIAGSSWTNITSTDNMMAAIAIDGGLFTWGSNANGQLGDNTVVSKSSPVKIGTSSWSVLGKGQSNMAAITSDGKLFVWGHNTNGTLGLYDAISRSSPVQVASTFVLTNSWSQVSAGSSVCVAIRASDSTVWSWGGSSDGMLGNGTTVSRSTPARVGPPFFSASLISTKGQTVGAISTTGELYMWGFGTSGQIGNGTNTSVSSPVKIGNSSWSIICASSSGCGGIDIAGRLFTWGSNSSGQLGSGTTVNRNSPVQVGGLTTWTDIDIGSTAFGRIGSTVYSWGNGTSGVLGGNTALNRSSPVAITGTWNKVVGGNSITAYGISTAGKLWAWGSGSNGALGDGTTVNKSNPVQIGTSDWSQIGGTCGVNFAVATDTAGRVFSWGQNNASNQLGDGTTTNKSSPVQIASGAKTAGPIGKSVTNAGFGGFYIASNGNLYGYGNNTAGQIGDGTVTQRGTPVLISSIEDPAQRGYSSWSAVTGGLNFMAGLDTTGALYTWGSGSNGVLGDGTTVSKSSPTKIGTSTWTRINAGYNGSLYGTLTNNLLYAWGLNGFGQLGDNTAQNKSSPVLIGISIKQINAGSQHVGIINSTDQIFAWGLNNNGPVGDGTTVNRSSPVSLSSTEEPSGRGYSSFSMISTGAGTLAITTTGALLAWGLGGGGTLGDGTTTNKSSPVQIGNSSWSFVKCSVTSSNSSAIDSNGRLFVWGNNNNGQIGDGTTINKSSPVLVDTVKGYATWTAYTGRQTMGGIADNGLYMWGNAAQGLGDGTTISKSTPVQIGNSSWAFLSVGITHAAAIDVNGRLFTWGRNDFGCLGDNTNISKSSPVQVGSSSWIAVTCGTGFNTAWTAAIDAAGRLFTWGSNGSNQLGDGTAIIKSSPVQIGVGTSFVKVCANSGSTNENYTYAISSDNKLYFWGSSVQMFGIPGIGNGTRNSPVLCDVFSSPVIDVKTSSDDHYVLLQNNTLWAWGSNNLGQLGDGTNTSKSVPVQVLGGTGSNSWTSVYAGNQFLAAVDINKILFMCGSNSIGYLGTGLGNASTMQSVPTVVGGWTSTNQVTVPSNNDRGPILHGIGVVDSNKELYSWGDGSLGSFGVGTTTGRTLPASGANIANTSNNVIDTWSSFDIGINHVIGARSSDNSIWVWGLNTNGELGLNNVVSRSSPTLIPSLETSVTARRVFATSGVMGVSGSTGLFDWGINAVGQLGNGFTLRRSAPIKIGTPITWSTFTTSYSRVGGIDTNGKLWVWGSNSNGMIGDGTTINKPWPVLIGGDRNWSQIRFGLSYTMAIDSTGKLWTWGLNQNGQLGDGTTISKSSPIQIGNSSWSAIACSNNFSHAITTDGHLYGWGKNNIVGVGQTFNDPGWNGGTLGDGTTINKSSPVQIGSNSNWSNVTHGPSNRVFATTTANTMFVWGLDDLRGFTAVGGGGSGLPLGFNERRRKSTIYYSPVQVPDSFANSALLVSSIAPSNNHISVVATDGALLTWGMNSNGELGDGYSIVSGFSLNRSQPLIIGNLNSYSSFIGFDSYLSWTIVSSVNRHVAGITTTGGLYAWGENSQGQIGDNSIVNKSQPIKIGNSSWSVISSGNQYTLGILTNNILYAWGNNFSGQLGDGTTVAKSSPIQIGTSSWSIVEAGENSEMQAGGSAQPLRGSAFGKDISGKLFAWGQGTLGQLADSTIISKSSPVQVATSYIGVGVSSVAAGVNHSVFLSKNSSGNTFIHTTGENNVGQLGDGTTINRSIPVPISEKTKGNTVYAGANTSFKV